MGIQKQKIVSFSSLLRCLRGFVSRDSPFFYSPLAFRVGQHLASNSRLRPFDEMAATERESDAAKMMLRVLLPTGRQTVVAVPSDYTGQVSHNTAALCFGFKKGRRRMRSWWHRWRSPLLLTLRVVLRSPPELPVPSSRAGAD